MVSVGVWIIGPVIAGTLVLVGSIVMIVFACRARRNAMMALQADMNNMAVLQANMMNNMGRQNFVYPGNNIGETSVWGLTFKNQNNNINNFGNGNGNPNFAGSVAYDPLNPIGNPNQGGFANNF